MRKSCLVCNGLFLLSFFCCHEHVLFGMAQALHFSNQEQRDFRRAVREVYGLCEEQEEVIDDPDRSLLAFFHPDKDIFPLTHASPEVLQKLLQKVEGHITYCRESGQKPAAQAGQVLQRLQELIRQQEGLDQKHVQRREGASS